jgi:hypothetical protein
MDKLEKLSIDVKAAGDALAQVQRSIADVRFEYTAMQKKIIAADILLKETTELKDKLAKIAIFVGGGGQA